MAKRKFDKCQKCGGEFTNEHHFAKLCKNCNPDAKLIMSPEQRKTRLVNDPRTRVLGKDDVDIRFLEYGIAVKCWSCKRDIEIISYKTQPHERKCYSCNRTYDVELVVTETDNDPAKKDTVKD